MMKYFVTSMTLVAMLAVAPAFAEGEGSSVGEAQKRTAPVTLSAEQITCVKNAISKREDGLIAGHDAYALAVKNAYTARKTALLAAWDKTDRLERRQAVRAADKAFSDAVKAARKTWNDTRRSLWKSFETEKKACTPQTTTTASVSSSDTGSAKVDASL